MSTLGNIKRPHTDKKYKIWTNWQMWWSWTLSTTTKVQKNVHWEKKLCIPSCVVDSFVDSVVTARNQDNFD